MNGTNLCKVYSFPLAFLHTLEIWSSKFSFQSSLTPSNFLHILFPISYLPKWADTFSLLLISKWHLSGLLLKRLLSNHWNKAVEASYNDRIISSILAAIISRVLSSAQLVISISLMIKYRSAKNTLNKGAPNFQPCGTPNIS